MKRLIAASFLVSVLTARTLSFAHMGPEPGKTPTPPPPPKPEIKVQTLAEATYCIYGQGGNIGVVATPGAVLMVDTQFDALAPAIQEEIRKLTPAAIRYVVDTHHHFDHVGGNPTFGKTATIVGHENVRQRLYTLPLWQKTNLPPLIKDLETILGSGSTLDPVYKQTLDTRLRIYKIFLDSAQKFKPEEVVAPAVVYSDSMRIFLGDEEVQIFHVAPGHTDGDSIVYFPSRKVVHMGDLFVNGTYPFIDIDGGGSSEGWLKNLDAVLSKIPDDTRVIPGHGEAGTLADVRKFRSYMKDLREAVLNARKAGRTLQQAISEIKLDKYADLKPTFMTLPLNIDQVWRESGGQP